LFSKTTAVVFFWVCKEHIGSIEHTGAFSSVHSGYFAEELILRHITIAGKKNICRAEKKHKPLEQTMYIFSQSVFVARLL